ncbi:uncharacterized protein METZ01_LOCUS21261, partial [marine metagenome]
VGHVLKIDCEHGRQISPDGEVQDGGADVGHVEAIHD